MNPRSRLTLTICGLALLVAALPAVGMPPDRGRGPGGGPGFQDGHRLEHLALRLELSDGQREQLNEILAARFDAGFDARRAMFEARRTLEERIHAETLDEAAVRQAAAALAALEADAAVRRARHLQELRRILTPEQLAELEEMREDRGRLSRRGPRGRGPGGRGPLPPGE